MLTRASIAAILLALAPRPAICQELLVPVDSGSGPVLAVLRAYYRNYQSGNWDALASYVLSPKLLERRGLPADSALVLRDRTRRRVLDHAVAPPSTCPSAASPMIDSAAIRIDGDWAEVSVPRCDGSKGGVDEFRMLYFEGRWRFIYSDMF